MIALMIITAAFEMTGVASIMPFIAVLSNPESAQSNTALRALYIFFGFSNAQHFRLFLGVTVFALLLASIGMKAINALMQYRFTLRSEYSIGRRLIENYLHQPYSWFLNKHSAELAKNILSEVTTASSSIGALMILISKSFVVISLLVLLLAVNINLTLFTSIILLIFYTVIVRGIRSFTTRLGKASFTENANRYSAASEAFGAAKEVKVGGLERVYIKRFAKPAEHYAQTRTKVLIARELPRYLLESIVFGGILLFTNISIANSNGIEETLPILSVFAFAALRLMPASQEIYTAIITLRVGFPALDKIYRDLIIDKNIDCQQTQSSIPQLQNKIELNNITFSYPKASQPSLRNLDLTIPANKTVGLVGSTGSGKTTTVDVILGLLTPQEGNLIVDEQVIDSSNTRTWQKQIGYVPQQIYLSDDSVAANIAFGVDPDQIEKEAVVRAASLANLHSFVTGQLPAGYETKVGERGVRLSGGQRQRIGIARALYHNPTILIMDEATSALDNLTEKAVMEAVNNLSRRITIILIAHRLTTVRQCDCIFLLEEGHVKAAGTYDQLQASNPTFQRMTGSA